MGFELESGGVGKGSEAAAPAAATPGKQSLLSAEPEEAADAAAPESDKAARAADPPSDGGGGGGGADDKPRTMTLGRGAGEPAGGPLAMGDGGGDAPGRGQRGGAAINTRAGVNGIEIRPFLPSGNGSNTRTNRVGVGEGLRLTAPARGGTWSTSRPSAPLDQSAPTAANDQQFVWRAPAGGGSVTFTWRPPSGEPKTVTMQIVEPNQLDFIGFGDKPVEPHGVATQGHLKFGPDDVSFAGAAWKEIDTGPAGDAKVQPGYFERAWKMGLNLRHTAAEGQPFGMFRGHEGLGSAPNDTAGIGGLPRIDGGYSGGSSIGRSPMRTPLQARRANSKALLGSRNKNSSWTPRAGWS